MSRRGWSLFVAMGVIWGVPYLFIKIAVAEWTPATLVLFRTGLAALILLPVAALRGQLRPVLRHWRAVLAFAAAELAVPWLLLSDAERHLTSSLTGLLLASVPLVGALFGWVTRTDRVDVRRLLGLLVGVVGVVALAGWNVGAGDVRALLELAVVAVGYAFAPFILARNLADAPRLGVIAAALAVTALVYLPVGLAQLPRGRPAGLTVVAVVVLAVLCTAVAFVWFFALIDEVGPARATVITYINPAVATALGVIVLDEPLTVGIVVGFVLVLAGSVLATRRPGPVPAEAQ